MTTLNAETASEFDFIVGLDASGSMGSPSTRKPGKTRWEEAQETIFGIASALDKFDADGTIDTSEKATLQAVIAKKFPHFRGSDIAKAIADADSELEFTVEGGVQMLLADIGKASPEEAPVIMVAVLAVANADGDFDDKEKSAARQIATRLGLSSADYGL